MSIKITAILIMLSIFAISGTAFSSTATIQKFYDGSKIGEKIVMVGDSTTETAPALYDELSHAAELKGATILNRGADGNTLQNFIDDKAYNGNGIKRIIDEKADLYVVSYGINDIRTAGRNTDQIKADLKTAIDTLLNETNAYILLRIPNTFLSSDPTSSNALQPLENAQLYSTELRDIYESFKGYSSRTDVIDIQSLVFGQKAIPIHPLMKDILHPNDAGYRAIAHAIIERISGKTHDEQIENQLSYGQASMLIQECKTNYQNSKTQIERDKWHTMADDIRKVSGQ